MPKIIRTLSTVLTSGLTVNYRLDDDYQEYELTGGGGGALAGSIIVTQDAADTLVKGTVYQIRYLGNWVIGGNTITIFGRSLSATEATKELYITAKYDGSAWSVDVFSDTSATAWVNSAKLNADVFASGADAITGTEVTKMVTPSALATWWTDIKSKVQTWALAQTFTTAPILSSLTASKFMASNGSKSPVSIDIQEIITNDVSFDTGELGLNRIVLPYNCTINSVSATVSKVLTATDATITSKIDGVNITGGLITLPSLSALDTNVSSTCTAANTYTAGQSLDFVCAKATPGGTAFVIVTITRTL